MKSNKTSETRADERKCKLQLNTNLVHILNEIRVETSLGEKWTSFNIYWLFSFFYRKIFNYLLG